MPKSHLTDPTPMNKQKSKKPWNYKKSQEKARKHKESHPTQKLKPAPDQVTPGEWTVEDLLKKHEHERKKKRARKYGRADNLFDI